MRTTASLLRVAVAMLLPCAFLAQAQTVVVRDVALVDPDGNAPGRATLVLRDGVIAAVHAADSQAAIDGAMVIDGHALFAMPGLMDAHVHAHRDGREAWHYPLYLAHGVTRVRDAGTHLGTALAVRDAVARNPSAPRVIWGSPPLDGAPPVLSFGLAAETPAAARELVRMAKREGFDFVKTYDRLAPEAYRAILDEAKRVGIAVEGHVPLASSPEEAVAGGQRAIDHLTLVLESCIPGALDWTHAAAGPDADSMALLADGRLAAALDRYDDAACHALFRRFADAGTWHIPTLVQLRDAYAMDDPQVVEDPALALVPAPMRQEWADHRNEAKPNELRAGMAVYARQLRMVGAMHRAGVRLLAGSDASNEPFVVPGDALHDELSLFVETGLTPLEALRTATTDAARYAGDDPSRIGFRTGAPADLVLLTSDPRHDIRNTRAIAWVIQRGVPYDRGALDGMRHALAQRAASTLRSQATRPAK
jgi:imidazolonepropionase-like amidohydrolase